MGATMEFNIKRDLFSSGDSEDTGDCGEENHDADSEQLLLRAGQNRVTIMATDREIGLVADYEAEVLREGEITLSARKLHEMVREIQGETIHVVKE